MKILLLPGLALVASLIFSTQSCTPAGGEGEGEGEGEGGACGGDADCDGARTCEQGRCVAPDGAACAADADCASALCDPFGACAPDACPEVGAACDALTVCSGGPCGRTCEAPGDRGAPCLGFSDDNPCPTSSTCAAGLVCAERNFGEFGDGACAPPADRAAGEPCAAAADCAAGLACDEPTQVCAAP